MKRAVGLETSPQVCVQTIQLPVYGTVLKNIGLLRGGAWLGERRIRGRPS